MFLCEGDLQDLITDDLFSNDFAIVVGETENTFCFNFKVENIKVLPGTYEVVVSQKLLSRFTSKNHDLTYYIALEPDSTFG